MTRESVYAHEMGHAQVFFSVQKAIFQTILSSYHIDDGTRSVSQISVLIQQALNASDALCAEESNQIKVQMMPQLTGMRNRRGGIFWKN